MVKYIDIPQEFFTLDTMIRRLEATKDHNNIEKIKSWHFEFRWQWTLHKSDFVTPTKIYTQNKTLFIAILHTLFWNHIAILLFSLFLSKVPNSLWFLPTRDYVNKFKAEDASFEILIRNESFFREKFTQFLFSPKGASYQVSLHLFFYFFFLILWLQTFFPTYFCEVTLLFSNCNIASDFPWVINQLINQSIYFEGYHHTCIVYSHILLFSSFGWL